MREARFDDLVNFSSLLWQWMLNDKNNDVLQAAVSRAFELYQKDLRLARQPLGDPDSFSAEDRGLALESFGVNEFRSLLECLKGLDLSGQRSASQKKLISKILHIGDPKHFEEKYEHWRRLEFSLEEVALLKSMLESVSSRYPALIKKLSGQEDEAASLEGFAHYVKQLEGVAAQAGKVVSQAGDAVKSVIATGLNTVMDQVVPNSALAFQSQAQSARDFILQGPQHLNKTAWDEETSIPFVARKWPSINMRMIDEVSRSFYRDSISAIDPLFGKEDRVVLDGRGADQSKKRGSVPAGSRSAVVSSGDHSGVRVASLSVDDDDTFVFLPVGDVIDEAAAEDKQDAVFAQLNPVLRLFASGVISPLSKQGHALIIYSSLLTLSHEAKKMKLVSSDSPGLPVVELLPANASADRNVHANNARRDDVRTEFVHTSFNFLAVAHSGDDDPEENSTTQRGRDAGHATHSCDFCLVSLGDPSVAPK